MTQPNRSSMYCAQCAQPLRPWQRRVCSEACYEANLRTARQRPNTPMPRVTVACHGCGTALALTEMAAARFSVHYCNGVCRDRMRAEARQRRCAECEAPFEARPYSAQRFCSQRCRAAYWGPRQRATTPPIKNKAVPLRTSEAARGEHKEWRAKVYQRDQWRCQWCGVSAHLQAHHIKSWASHPDLRTDVANGVTLCIDCHREWHRLYGRPRRTTAIAPLPSLTDQEATTQAAG